MEKLDYQTQLNIPKPTTTDKKCFKHKNTFMQEIVLPNNSKKIVCPLCVSEKIQDEDKIKVDARLRKIKEVETIGLFERESDLNPELMEANFNNFLTENTSEKKMKSFGEQIATYYEKGGNGNTIFYGGSGVGKSHIAISILKQLNKYHKDFRLDKSVLFISVEALMARIKDSFKNKESRYTEENMLKLLTSADFLVLDDLGTESKMSKKVDDANNWIQQFLFKVLDLRDTTIITTNLSENDMRKLYNDKLVSRIFKGVGQKSFEVPVYIQSKRRDSLNSSIPFEFHFEEDELPATISRIEPVIETDLVGNVFAVSEEYSDKLEPQIPKEKPIENFASDIESENDRQNQKNDNLEPSQPDTAIRPYISVYTIGFDDPRMKVENLRDKSDLPEQWKAYKGETDEEHLERIDGFMPVEFWFLSDTPNLEFPKNPAKNPKYVSEQIKNDKEESHPETFTYKGVEFPWKYHILDGETEEDWMERVDKMWIEDHQKGEV